MIGVKQAAATSALHITDQLLEQSTAAGVASIAATCSALPAETRLGLLSNTLTLTAATSGLQSAAHKALNEERSALRQQLQQSWAAFAAADASTDAAAQCEPAPGAARAGPATLSGITAAAGRPCRPAPATADTGGRTPVTRPGKPTTRLNVAAATARPPPLQGRITLQDAKKLCVVCDYVCVRAVQHRTCLFSMASMHVLTT